MARSQHLPDHRIVCCCQNSSLAWRILTSSREIYKLTRYVISCLQDVLDSLQSHNHSPLTMLLSRDQASVLTACDHCLAPAGRHNVTGSVTLVSTVSHEHECGTCSVIDTMYFQNEGRTILESFHGIGEEMIAVCFDTAHKVDAYL